MKNIGIVTLEGYFNYGNRLQNYALKHVIEELGFEVKTTVIDDYNIFDRSLNTQFKKILKMPFKLQKKILISKLNLLKRYSNRNNVNTKNNRTGIFKEFSNKYLDETFFSLSNPDDVKYLLENYSYFITGSDQVWNPDYIHKLHIYFLSFVPAYKRIAYAPSIGRDKLPIEYEEKYKKWFEGMNSISVREESGANIIESLTGIEAPVMADPTMLLSKEQWLSVSNRSNKRPNAPYLLTYFLGGPTEEARKELERLADEKNMKVINLGDVTEKEIYETGPSEFLDFINNASAFFTDSFHGVVFSIIFQTPFVVYERQSSGPSMYSRIETILDNFDMRDREAEGFDQDIFSMDFSGTYEVLEREYEKSINYLKEALRIEE